jgi:hypothetical protein
VTSARSDRASFLAAVAALGLIVTPLLHAEEHQREEHQEGDAEAAAIAEAWRSGSTDPIDKLAFALEYGHAPQPSGPAAPHRHEDGNHKHTHGPADSGPHGSGALGHLGLALSAAPQLPQVAAVPPAHAGPAAVTAQVRGTLRYLVPEWSQGPPLGC